MADPRGALGTRAPHSPVSFITAANEVWGKVIFLHLFVILFTGGGSTWAGTPPGTRYTPLGLGTPPRPGNPPGPGTPPRPGTPPGRYGQQAGGTHPTGMHSCFHVIFGKQFAK